MFRRLRSMPVWMPLFAASLALVVCSCKSFRPTINESDCGEDPCPAHAKVCKHPTMHALACDIDFLEAHIDKYGSVVAKHPDIWGQARLTKYRDDFEKQMVGDLGKFAESLQGSLLRSDQAFLASATAISAAINGQQAGAAPPARVMVQNNTAQGVASTPIPVPDATPTAAVFNGIDAMTRTAVRTPLTLGFATMATGGISLEPTIVLDQKARYLDHLNQIRRNNEGDDTADSPGYSLNLVRVPVSVFPGKCTQKGYGAEITMTMTPYIGEELLPTTFRQLVLNDLVDLLALPAAKFADAVVVNELPATFGDVEKEEEAVQKRIADYGKQIDNLIKESDAKITDAQGRVQTEVDTAIKTLDARNTFWGRPRANRTVLQPGKLSDKREFKS